MNDSDDLGKLGDLDPRAVLREVKDTRAVEYAAAARQLSLAARWADLHPPESIEDTCVFPADRGGEIETPIAGPGCPAVAEFCVADLGAALGVSTLAAKRLMGHALELRHRLPRLWARVQSGEVPPWRARSVAEETIQAHPALTKEAAAWVDAQVAPFAAGIGYAQIQRMVTEAIRRFQLADPATADQVADSDALGGNRRKVELVGDLMPYSSRSSSRRSCRWPMPSIWIATWPTGPRPWPRWGRPSRWTPAAPRRWAISPASRPPSTSPD